MIYHVLMAQTIFLAILIFVVGLVLQEKLYQIKKILKKKELQDNRGRF